MTGRYETIIVGAPTLTEDENTAIVSALESTITEGKGTVIRTEPWGKRKLAHRVNKFDEGYYTLFFYEGAPSLVREVERRVRMNDQLIRFITVKVDWEEKVARAEALRAASQRSAPARPAVDAGFGEAESEDAGGEYEGGRG